MLGASSVVVSAGRLRRRRCARRAALFDQSLEPVGEIAWHGLEQAGELLHRGGHEAGELGEQFLARCDVGQSLGIGLTQDVLAEHAPFDHQMGIALREVAKRLGHRDGISGAVAGNERDGGRAGQQVLDLQTQLANGEPYERVLVDLVVATGGPKRPTQGLHVLHIDAAVLREQRGLATGEALTHLVDHGHFLWSRIVHRTSSLVVRRLTAPPRGAEAPVVPVTKRTQGARVQRTPRGSLEVSASSGGPGGEIGPLRRNRAPEVFGEQELDSIVGRTPECTAGLEGTGPGPLATSPIAQGPTIQAASPSNSNMRLGSTLMPGPIVDESVIRRK